MLHNMLGTGFHNAVSDLSLRRLPYSQFQATNILLSGIRIFERYLDHKVNDG